MKPRLAPEKRRKMISFMISPEAKKCLEETFDAYKEKIFHRFTKTDLFEMGIWHLSQDLKKKSIVDLYAKYIEGKVESLNQE